MLSQPLTWMGELKPLGWQSYEDGVGVLGWCSQMGREEESYQSLALQRPKKYISPILKVVLGREVGE